MTRLDEVREFLKTNKTQIVIIGVALAVGVVSYVAEKGEVLNIGRTSVPETAPVSGTSFPSASPNQLPASISGSPFREGACISYVDAGEFVGQDICVRGKVVRVYVSQKGTTFFDFCANYKTCQFSAVIFASQRSVFGDVYRFNGRTAEITGLVKTYQGRPEIILENASQIRIVQ